MAVTTPNGVGNVTGVPETVTQSPSVANAEVTEYAVMRREVVRFGRSTYRPASGYVPAEKAGAN